MFLFTFIFMFHGVTELEIFLLRVSRDILREVGGVTFCGHEMGWKWRSTLKDGGYESCNVGLVFSWAWPYRALSVSLQSAFQTAFRNGKCHC